MYNPEQDYSVDWDEICGNDHRGNRVALRDLVDALYSPDDLNIDFIEEKLEWLCASYGVTLPKEDLKIRRVI